MREPDLGLIGGHETPGQLARVGDRVAWYASAVGLERWARLAAVAIVPLFLPEGWVIPHGPVLAGLAVYVLATALTSRDQYVRAADILVAAILIVLQGPNVVAFLPFLLVTVAGPASQGGMRAGLAAGGTLTSVLLARLVLTGEFAELGFGGVAPLALLLPLAGLTTAAASQILDDRAVRDRLMLQQANRLLASLRDIAEDIPGGLDVSTVSAALLVELRSVAGAAAVIIFAEDHGVMRPAASNGIQHEQLKTLRIDELRDLIADYARLHTPHELPDPLPRACADHVHWVVLPLGPVDTLPGVLLVGFDDLESARAARPRLGSLAADGGIALENARLFDGTRTRAADAARRKVAGDLHDGVAQSLAHIRMELELMSLTGDTGSNGEVARLARVAGTALSDLRATIGGLRRPMDGDLVSLLERHLDDVRTPHGPDLKLAHGGPLRLDADRTEELLRVAQEAISNALRHAQAASVSVTVEQEPDGVTLLIEDDGVGLEGTTTRPGGGVGLRSMRERAERLGGELDVLERAGGGTCVALRLPQPSASSTAGRGP